MHRPQRQGRIVAGFRHLTQRVVVVSVQADGGDTVTVLADDGGDIVAKEIPS
jgi:hypothetical protein